MYHLEAYFNPNKAKPEPVSTPGVTADGNGDGKVDGLDYLLWATHFGQTVTGGPAEGDFNNDGKVDGLDYLVWIEQKDADVPDMPADPTDVVLIEPAPEILPEPAPVPVPAGRLDGWDLSVQGVPKPSDPSEYAQIISMFPPLQKVHWSWPWSKELYENTDLAVQVARVSGSVGCSAKWDDTQAEVDRAVSVANAAGVDVCLQYSPYHEHYAQRDARFWGDKFRAAVADAQLVAVRFRSLFDQAKLNVGAPNVQVSCVYFDQELLRSDINENGSPDPLGGQRQDQLVAVAAKNDIVYRIFREQYPEPDFLWHAFTGHGVYHSPEQLNDGWGNTELYLNQGGPEQLRYQMLDFARDCKEHGIEKLCPAVSVGGYYDVSVAAPHPGYVRDKAYPVKYSWHKGRNINHPYFASEQFADRFGPTWKIQKLFWWPSPFAPSHVGYGEHFIAYLAGAHNVKVSEDSWLDTEEY